MEGRRAEIDPRSKIPDTSRTERMQKLGWQSAAARGKESRRRRAVKMGGREREEAGNQLSRQNVERVRRESIRGRGAGEECRGGEE